jgi:quercetin dioxygenase-like cupin family protein
LGGERTSPIIGFHRGLRSVCLTAATACATVPSQHVHRYEERQIELTTVRCGIPIAALLAILGAIALVSFQAGAQAQAQTHNATTGPGPTQVVVLDNARVQIRRITFPAGTGLPMHTVGTPGDNRLDIAIQLTPAKLEGQVDDKKTVSDTPGNVWEVPGAPSQHAFHNLSDQTIEMMVVQVK